MASGNIDMMRIPLSIDLYGDGDDDPVIKGAAQFLPSVYDLIMSDVVYVSGNGGSSKLLLVVAGRATS